MFRFIWVFYIDLFRMKTEKDKNIHTVIPR